MAKLLCIFIICFTSFTFYQSAYHPTLVPPVANCTQQVKTVVPNNQLKQDTIAFEKNKYNSKLFSTDKTEELHLEGLALTIPIGALSVPTLVSIKGLSDGELPELDADLVNVTKAYKGYRLLPHGLQFQKEVAIVMAYDTALIPDGYTKEDIRTFYFDETTAHWKAIRKDSLWADKTIICSKTTHFTDFISGIIKVPESPQTQGYTPTSIKDLKAADPSVGITTIAPPTGHNRGTANTSFPLTLPKGRQGIAPNLAIQYNNEGENGWLGLGWSVQTPAISLDTRWGVPRYDTALETETYLLNGEQLSPVGHRGVLQNRRAEKRFYPRVEDDFHKIIRHGTTPKNYWWEVIDKEGKRSFYGGRPNSGVLDSAVLKDGTGNIAHWALVEVRDLDQNFMRYHYTTVEDVGVVGGTVMGYQLYLDKITYTGHQNTEGAYQVLFIRDRQLNEPKRTDIAITARLGFKQVSADLLRRIVVQFQDKRIRSYELNYTEGAFYKTLLSKITEKDRDGKDFYSHQFDYYDDIRQGNLYQPFKPETIWQVASDRVKVGLFNPLGLVASDFNGETSVLGGSKSANYNLGIAITVGPNIKTSSKSLSAGANFSYAISDAEGLITLADIDGDGLADKVFRQGGQLMYRPNLSKTGIGLTAFGGTALPILGVDHFSRSSTRGFAIGAEANAGFSGFGAFAGYSYARSKTRTETYFADFNGDGLIDIVSKGRVYFNKINGQGNPEFVLTSDSTSSPIIANAAIDTNMMRIDPVEQDKLIDSFPLHDVVRMWEAPYTGTISMTVPIKLIEDRSQDAQQYLKRDGVRIAIQKNREDIITPFRIDKNDFSEKIIEKSTTVNKGDRLYFRVQSVFDGAYDKVVLNPLIIYTGLSQSETDANNKKRHRFKASEDFLLAANQTTTMPLNGRIHIEGLFKKPITSDSVRVDIVAQKGDPDRRTERTLLTQLFPPEIALQQAITWEGAVDSSEELLFKVTTATNINWSSVAWQPHFYYKSADNGMTVVDSSGQTPKYLLAFSPAVAYSMFTDEVVKTPIWVADTTASCTISPVLAFNTGLPPSILAKLTGKVTLSLKGNNKLYDRKTVQITEGVVPNNMPSVNARVTKGDSLYIEYHISNRDIVTNFIRKGVNVSFVGNAPSGTVGVFTQPQDSIFGALYRGWGQFVYNGNRDKANQPIVINDLEIDPALRQSPPPPYHPEKSKFVLMVALPDLNAWRGYDNLTYIQADTMSSSRMGEDDIAPDKAIVSGQSTTAYAPNKITLSNTHSISGGVSGGISVISGSASGSKSWNETENTLDVMDMNGDRYPDIVGVANIQYTTSRGGLENTQQSYDLGSHQAKSEAEGFTLGGGGGGGGGFVVAHTFNVGNNAGAGSNKNTTKTDNNTNKLASNASESQKVASNSIGVSGSVNMSANNDETVSSWLDINGDGLVDKVFKEGMVALNLGYRFAPKEKWGYQDVRTGTSRDYGGGLGVNIDNGTITAGISLTRTDNFSKQGLQDVNGDGLIDQINETGTVKLNTGNGFGTPIEWQGIGKLDEGSSTGESLNVGFTIGIPIFFIKICINPSFSTGQGVSRPKTQITDINGDGFPDLLTSTNDGELKVKQSTIGRTNLLKKVSRPFGAFFTMDYALAGNTYNLPHSKWVLKSVAMFDGFKGDGADTTKTAFDYQDGVYNRHEREFYGFKTVKSHQLDTENNDKIKRSSISTYDNSNYYQKGLLLSEILQDGDNQKFTETRNIYALKDTVGNTLPAIFGNNTEGVAFPALIETQKLFYEGQVTARIQTQMTYEYDRYGNVVVYTDKGDGTANDSIKAFITYHNNDALYIKSTPASIEVKVQGTMRKRQTTLNNTGNITQIRQFLQDSTSANVDMAYDIYGNLIKITRPPNHKNEQLSFDYTYDNTVHTYTTEVKDSYGYTSKSAYDYLFEQVLETTDMNGQKMVYTIDPKGRIMTITGPYETGKPYTIAFDYKTDAPIPYAKTRHYDPEHNTDIETFTFMDGLLRPLQVKKTGSLFSTEGGADNLKMLVSGRVIYDALGRTVKSYYPTDEPLSDSTVFNRLFDTVAPTLSEFDVLDRPTLTTLPDGSKTQMQYTIDTDNTNYTAFKTTVTDALNNVKEAFSDVRQRKRATKDMGATAIWTHFRYNALSELIKIIDNNQNEISYTYDQLGRKLTVNHPDQGLTALKYDLAGNMTEKITANIRKVIPNGGAIKYTYDKERLVQIDYPKNYQNKIQLHYGDTSAASRKNNRVGRLWLQEDASGGQEFFFGRLGEITKNIRTVMISEANVQTFVSEFQYDTWNRVKKMVYPDGEEVIYVYNRAGKLQTMSGKKGNDSYAYVTQLGYDKFEQRTFLKQGNGTATNYQYTPLRRQLSNLTVKTPSKQIFINNNYAYDVVSNITSIQNNAPIEFGGNAKHTYTYDKLYRLSTANGEWTGVTGFNRKESYALSMSYDNLHNITHKTQNHIRGGQQALETTYDNDYQYTPNQKPHAPNKIGQKRYTYDANGNLENWRGEGQNFTFRQIIWDEENRILGISTEGSISQYTYDANGERVIKSHGGAQSVFISGAPAGAINHNKNYTAYISPYMVVGDNKFTKHYYIEGQRIATKIGNGTFDNQFFPNRGITAGNLDYIQRLQLQQKAVNDFYKQQGLPPGPPTLPNYYGQPERTGNPIPATSQSAAYTRPPNGWPLPTGPPSPNGPPGPPVWLRPEVTNDNVKAGYGFIGTPPFPEVNQYFYHPDHLGSTNYVTDAKGNIRQHTEYMPFGETFVEEHTTSDALPYLFNAKELDSESGLYYYGARYYDPKTSIWVSVDPMAEKFPSWSPYNYTMQNPVILTDPDGRIPTAVIGAGIGAVIGSGVEIGMQLYTNGSVNNWKAVGGSAVQGAITGAAVGLTGGLSLLGTAGVSGTANVIGGAANNVIQGKEIGSSIAKDFVIGAAFGAVGKYLGDKANMLFNKWKALSGNTSKNIHLGQQGKHILGHNNYIQGRSVLTEDAQGLLDAFHSGNIRSAQTINTTKTRVDFGKTIGTFINEAGEAMPTTRGIIHNSKTGAHIVPALPKD